ncbi:MAG: HTH domain-containing protein [Rhodococcus sp. (in: high G+C Gram-positive bacteria)]|uniref:hypothetical protein n=1 Tax=Rhodococcus sp. TaxID=1831 RepID=UPI003BB16037
MNRWDTDEWLHTDRAVTFSGLSALRLRDLRIAGAIQGRKSRDSWWYSRESLRSYVQYREYRKRDHYGCVHPLRSAGWKLMQTDPPHTAQQIAKQLGVTPQAVTNWQIQLLHHYARPELWDRNTDQQLAKRFAMTHGTVARARERWSRKHRKNG